MKKRIVAAVLVLVLALSLFAGCGEKKAPAPTFEEFFNKIKENTPFGEAALMPLDGDAIAVFYEGLTKIETEEIMIFTPMISAVVCEIALVQVKNSKDVEAAKAALQARIDYQVDGGAWYPDTIDGWVNNSHIEVAGNYLMLVAVEGADSVVTAFKEAYGA